jgi:Ca-activated chloride channel homolog
MSMPAIETPSLPSTGAIAVDIQGRVLPLRGAQLTAHAVGGHARVVLEQTFVNAHAQALDVTYKLPLPADAAVAGFRFTLNGTEVVGRVESKAQARESFERALVEGRSAALLEEERSSVFTQRLGNVPPGETLTVHIELDQPLAWEQGQWTWRFPTVVGPRYLGANPGPEAAGVVVDIATSRPDARLSATVHIADDCTGAPTSPSHALEVEAGRVALSGHHALDRDVVVRWPVARAEPSVRAQVCRRGDDAYAAITVVPPAQVAEPVARHLVVLLDTSGSMNGAPLRQAQELTAALIATLGAGDHLELLAFAQSVERFQPEPLRMDLQGRRQALAWLQARRASGGTEMTTGIRAAVSGRGVEGAQKQVVIVTDGYIGFEAEIVAIALDERDANTRVHTVGVGSSVNRSLTEPVARAGGGQELIIGIDETVGAAASRLVAHTQQPVVVDLQLVGAAVCTTTHRLPDLYAGAPVTLYAQVRLDAGPVTLTGRTASGEWSVQVALTPSDDGVAGLRWARDQVADLELLCAAERRRAERERRIEAIGVDFQISTRFTSWVATTTHQTVNPDGPSLAQTQPQALPYGVSAEGVGLRQVGMFGAGGGDTSFWSRSVSAEGGPVPSAAPAAPKGGMSRSRRSVDKEVNASSVAGPASAPRLQAAPIVTESKRERADNARQGAVPPSFEAPPADQREVRPASLPKHRRPLLWLFLAVALIALGLLALAGLLWSLFA